MAEVDEYKKQTKRLRIVRRRVGKADVSRQVGKWMDDKKADAKCEMRSWNRNWELGIGN